MKYSVYRCSKITDRVLFHRTVPVRMYIQAMLAAAHSDNALNVQKCQDASRIHSSEDRDLPEGLRANTASHCLAPLKLILSSFMALA